MSAVQNPVSPFLLSEAEAAELLGISADYLYRLRIGKIPASRNPPPVPRHLRIGKLIRYRPADIDAWLDAMASGTAVRRVGRPTKAEAARRREAQARAESNLAA